MTANSWTNVDEPWGHSDATGNRIAPRGDNLLLLVPAVQFTPPLLTGRNLNDCIYSAHQELLYYHLNTFNRLHQTHPLSYPSSFFFPESYGWGGIFNEGKGIGLAHDGSNGSWYCSAVVYPVQEDTALVVTNIGDGINGNGQDAVAKVIELLNNRQLNSIVPEVIISTGRTMNSILLVGLYGDQNNR